MRDDGLSRRSALRLGLAGAGLAVGGLLPAAAGAQQFPTKGITWVIPFAAGGGTDLWGRVMAQAMSAKTPHPVTAVNQPGASGVVGWRNMLAQPADGYHVLQGSPTPIIGLLSENRPPFAPSEIKIVCYISAFRPLLAVRPNAPYKDWASFVDFGKKNPGKIVLGATSTELIAVSLALKSAGVEFTAVPYSSTSESVTDFLGAHIDAVAATEATMTTMGSEKARVILNASKLELTPDLRQKLGDVPLASALGYQVMSAPRWIGVHPNTPDPIVDYLEGQIRAALDADLVKSAVAKVGEEIVFVPRLEAQADYRALVDGVRSAVGLLKK